MTLFILRKDIAVGVVQKMAIYLILCSENVLTYLRGWGVQKRPKITLRNIKMVPDVYLGT